MIVQCLVKMAAPVFNTNTDSLPVNPDLQKERATASFNVLELTHILDGGAEITKRRKELGKITIIRTKLLYNLDLDSRIWIYLNSCLPICLRFLDSGNMI